MITNVTCLPFLPVQHHACGGELSRPDVDVRGAGRAGVQLRPQTHEHHLQVGAPDVVGAGVESRDEDETSTPCCLVMLASCCA